MRHKLLFFMAFFLFALFPLLARDVEILVEDTDLGLPLEGAVIRSWNGEQYTCNENGKAIISVPDERQVVIQAAYPGYESGRIVIAATGAASGSAFTLGLRLSGVMVNKELVIEVEKPGSSETKTGRSVAVSGRDITQTAEIGIIEDVMSSIKLLPGVGYTGLFDAQPSIRGGDPGDMHASLDGFFISNPYHWGGGFSIFDPRMVESAQLSHGVFSSRYGHTISGLLEITTKEPSPSETQFELGVSTSMANFYFSLPLVNKGGILFMGRVTYYDPVIALAKQMSKIYEDLEIVNSILTAPYIRSGTITGNYRFFNDLELRATGFWGMDGVAVNFENPSDTESLKSDTRALFEWTNYQGFFTSSLSWNPRNDMLLKFSAGTGYEDSVVDGDMRYLIYSKSFSDSFKTNYFFLENLTKGFTPYEYEQINLVKESDFTFNAQGRIDYDWDLGNGFLAAAGIQELFNQYKVNAEQQIPYEKWYGNLDDASKEKIASFFPGLPPEALNVIRINLPANFNPNIDNKLFTTSGYTLVEYHTPASRFKTELGLRVDHFYLLNENFSLQSKPSLNPRLNLDFNVFKDSGFVQSLDISAGTGLFASVNNIVTLAEEKYNIKEAKPNRSWTSVLGSRLEFTDSLIFNVEGYYKYIYDRTYVPVILAVDDLDVRPQFDGEGRVWGVDFFLQKLQSRFWDGWVSYSYSWAKYRDPNGMRADLGFSGGVYGNDWYFPSYHRFHNLNLVLNIKPTPRFNLYVRFGVASGVQISKRIGDGPVSYPVFVYNDDQTEGYFIEKYYWPAVRDEENRTTPSLPLDIKFSIFGKNDTGKVRHELYVAVENALALLYSSQGNTSFNSYTGEIDRGSNSASYEIPIPIPSFGFKISY